MKKDRLKNHKKHLRFMYSLTEGYRGKYITLFVLSFLTIIFAMFTSYMSKIVVDCFTKTNDVFDIYYPDKLGPIGRLIILMFGGADYIMGHKWILAVGVFAFGLISAGIAIIRGLIRGDINTSISKRIRIDLFNHIERLPYSYIKSHNNGDFLQSCMRDETVLRQFITFRLDMLIQTLLRIILSFVILLTVDYRLAFISIIIVPVLIIYSIILVKKEAKLYRDTDDSEAVIIGKIEENINSIRVIKAFNNERYEIDQFDKDLSDYHKKYKKHMRLSMFYVASSDILIFGEIIATALVGAIYVYYGEISLGTMVIATTFTSSIVWPIRECINTIIDYVTATVSIDRMNEILTYPLENIDEGLDVDIHGDIEFNDVSFAFDDDKDNPVIKNLSFKIKQGSTVAIMGKTGSGKSLTAHLLTRLYDYDSGSIKIDGIELKDISKKCIRRNISIVLQEPFLFSRTILENLKIKEKDVSIKEIEKATKIADMHNTILSFKDGYNTLIGERGTTLSGGQRQRLAMARSLLNNSPINIFDDSLSAVDAETDVRIRTALHERKTNSTNIIITHRVMTAQNADLIIVLDNGRVLEMGNHKELINNHGFYEKIFKIQTRID